MYLSIRITARLLHSEIHSQRICVRLSMLIRLLLTLCSVMVLPNPLFGQEYPAKHDNPSALQRAADIPVRGTEAERAEAQQAESKEEALKSLVVHGPYTVLPLPVFAYNRNESYWVGTVVPILQSNSKDELQHIYASFYSHNRYVGETLGLYYYGYPSDTT